MPTITVYLDDSAEERRRRRRRILGGIIFLLALLGIAATRSPTQKRIFVKEPPVEVIVTKNISTDIQGPSAPPRAAIAPAQLEFESLPVGRSATKYVTIRNIGGYPLDISLNMRGDGFSMTRSCGKAVSEHDTCMVDIAFTPQRLGRHSGAVSIRARDEVTTVALSGNATAQTIIRPPPRPPDREYTFKFDVRTPWSNVKLPIVDRIGKQRVLRARIAPRHIHFIRPGSKRVIVSNPHDEPIHVRRIVLEGVGYELKGDEKCTTLLNPGQSCTFSVVAKLVSSYSPTAHLTIE